MMGGASARQARSWLFSLALVAAAAWAEGGGGELAQLAKTLGVEAAAITTGCSVDDFPIVSPISNCHGFNPDRAATSAAACQATCCSVGSMVCQMWQYQGTGQLPAIIVREVPAPTMLNVGIWIYCPRTALSENCYCTDSVPCCSHAIPSPSPHRPLTVPPPSPHRPPTIPPPSIPSTGPGCGVGTPLQCFFGWWGLRVVVVVVVVV